MNISNISIIISIIKKTIAKIYTNGWYYWDLKRGINEIHKIQYPTATKLMPYLTHIGTFNKVKQPKMYPMIIVQKYAGTPRTTAITGCPG